MKTNWAFPDLMALMVDLYPKVAFPDLMTKPSFELMFSVVCFLGILDYYCFLRKEGFAGK
jgi:hypothetical protein